MGSIGSAGIYGVFGGGVEAIFLVGGHEVSLQVDPRLVSARFLVPALSQRPKSASLVHEVLAHKKLLLIRDGVPAGFGKGNTVLDLLELIVGGPRRHPRGGHIFSI